MKNKAKVIKLSIMFIVTFITLIMVAFAWFIAIDKTDPIIIESGTLRVSAKLYFHEDSDGDGQVEEEDYQLVTNPISIVNVLPGSVFYYKLVVKNNGSVPGHLSVDIIGIEYSDPDKMSDVFDVAYIDPILGEDQIVKSISSNQVNLFIEKVIAANSEYTFYFQIISGPEISDEMAGDSLKLSSFLVTLNQIRPKKNL